MKFSQNIQRCGLSPMRKFNPYAVKAKAAGKKIFHLNIGQPDIETPPAFFDAITGFRESVLAYAPSPGVPAYLDAVRDYYVRMGIEIETSDILATTGGSEALQIALSCILDPGDEILVPEPFYPNYNTFVSLTGGKIAPIPTTPEEGYFYADRERIESHRSSCRLRQRYLSMPTVSASSPVSMRIPAPSCSATPATPPALS